MKIAAGVLFTDGKKVLLLKKCGDTSDDETWGLPGGKGRDGENETETAKREIQEETGLDDLPGTRFASISNEGDDVRYTAFLHRINDIFKVRLSGEHSDWEWVALANLKSQNLHPKLRENLPRYLEVIQKEANSFKEWLIIRHLIATPKPYGTIDTSGGQGHRTGDKCGQSTCHLKMITW